MKIMRLLIAFCTTSVLSISILGSIAAAEKRQSKIRDVQVTIQDTVSCPARPIVELSTIMRKNVQSQRFRINWGYSMGSYVGHSTAIFDRGKETINFFAYGSGDEGRHKPQHVRFTQVSEDAVNQIMQKYKDRSGGGFDDIVFAYLNHLLEYGSRKQILKSNER